MTRPDQTPRFTRKPADASKKTQPRDPANSTSDAPLEKKDFGSSAVIGSYDSIRSIVAKLMRSDKKVKMRVAFGEKYRNQIDNLTRASVAGKIFFV